jgi:hypothetical protein
MEKFASRATGEVEVYLSKLFQKSLEPSSPGPAETRIFTQA